MIKRISSFRCFGNTQNELNPSCESWIREILLGTDAQGDHRRNIKT